MTAIVGILNKHAVAVAADSALTVGNDQNHKIYNTSQKIFQLAKKQPIGVMTYGDAEFMGVPLDVIIKLYYDKSGDKDLPTVEAYRDDFLTFLKNKRYFTNEDEQKDALYGEMLEVIRRVYDAAKDRCFEKEHRHLEEVSITRQVHYCNIFMKELIDTNIDNPYCEGLEKYTFEQFKQYASSLLEKLYSALKESEMPALDGMWDKAIFEYLRSKRFWNHTGLVFVGYGSEQIYPALAHVDINIAFDGHLRMQIDPNENVSINNDNSSQIRAFGQADVIISFIRGLSEDVCMRYNENICSNLKSIKTSFSEMAQNKKCSKEVLDFIKNINEQEIAEKIDTDVDEYIRQVSIERLHDSISSFEIPDMTSMAESLISVTNLQRHITSSEESVGGPVDVAVITRSEGFVWVKHKNWFTKE